VSQQTSRFYNRFRFLYPLVDVFLKPQKRRLIHKINAEAAGRLLDIGVGNGSHLPLYRGHHVTGVDTSAGMLAVAAKHQNINVRLLQMNGEQLLFANEAFDYVVLSHVIAVVDDPERLMQEVYRVLKPQGKVFILNHITPDNWLQYADRAFGLLAGWLHFKSVFTLSQIPAISRFRLLQEVALKPWGYFKIYNFQKP
jgi:phosphatidylethanolamine/phosphatidyl-N-methylethanolamine N-methyltransferase